MSSKVVEPDFVSLVDTGAKYDKLVEKRVEEKVETNPGFYIFTRNQILEATTPAYRQFLKDAGYVDLDNCEILGIGKGLLKWSDEIRSLAEELNLQCKRKILTGKDGEYIVDITQPDARKLVEETGYKLLTSQLMYNLFIPYIKEEAENGNEDAKGTLEEMIDSKQEWLEDLIIDKSKLIINNKKINILLPKEGGKFNREDLSEFGYPIKLTSSNGEFSYTCPRYNKGAVIRDGGSWLGLNLDVMADVGYHFDIGVRLAKFVMEKK